MIIVNFTGTDIAVQIAKVLTFAIILKDLIYTSATFNLPEDNDFHRPFDCFQGKFDLGHTDRVTNDPASLR